MKEFDRSKIKTFPLAERENKLNIEELVSKIENYFSLNNLEIKEVANKIFNAKKKNKPVIITFGAHLIKNGLGFVLIKLLEKGFVSHLATNGAGSIHDWEFAYQGKSGEDVRERVARGAFGLGEETGKFINLAIKQGSLNSLGYGESVGKMISEDRVGEEFVEHNFKQHSLQCFAFEKNIALTIHPGYGYDIIYTHPLVDGVSIGKVSEIDFLRFVESVSNLEGGGVYLSIGSAIMSPMIFEKSLSMARNVALQNNEKINDFMIVVNDIQDEKTWDFGTGKEPSENDPAYYSRLCKSFDRMGAREMKYIKMDNRDFLIGLMKELEKLENI